MRFSAHVRVGFGLFGLEVDAQRAYGPSPRR